MARTKHESLYLSDVTTRHYDIKITGKTDLLVKTRIDTSGNDRDNPYTAAADALYWLDGKPLITDRAGFEEAIAAHPRLGFPVYAVKKTTLAAVRATAAKPAAAAMLNASFDLIGLDGGAHDQGTGPLGLLEYESVEPFPSPDGKRTVARIHGWSMVIKMRHLEQSKLTVDKIVKALNKGGKNGIGSYAPCGYMTEPGKFGTFKAELLD